MLVDDRLPRTAVDLSDRLRRLRQRSGQTQSAISRALGLDPSIPSLWEQGRRLVPPTRLVGLAEALEVTLDELLEGIGPPEPARDRHTTGLPLPATSLVMSRSRESTAPPGVPVSHPTATVVHGGAAGEGSGTTTAPVWPHRASAIGSNVPAADQWVPEGWGPGRALPTWGQEVPEGLWLDARRLDRPDARQLLRGRLCADDRGLVSTRDVNGFALAERLLQHCARQAEWTRRLPVAETLFRAVVGSSDGGLTVDRLVLVLTGRISSDITQGPTLIRRLGPSLRRAYPVHWAER